MQTAIRVIATGLVLWASGACTNGATPVAPGKPTARPSAAADVAQSSTRPPEVFWNRYIVILRSNAGRADSAAARLTRQFGGRQLHVIDAPATAHAPSLKAFGIANLPDSALALLKRHPSVAAIIPDAELRYYAVQTLPSDDTQWALDQIDQRSWPPDRSFAYFFPGAGVHIYIVDTGVRGDHTEFAGRIGVGKSTVGGAPDLDPYSDIGGHGTAVAGAAAGTTYGVAKSATVHSVRVSYDKTRVYTLDAVAGFDWVRANAVRPAVVNFSANTNSTLMRDALARMYDAEITIVKAAGEGDLPGDACTDVGNTVQWAIVVGATDRDNARTAFSDYGNCISVFAPGLEVRTADYSSPNGAYNPSGTSYAAPLVAGVAASVLQELVQQARGDWLPARAYNIVTLSATRGAVTNLSGSPDRLLNSLHRYIDFQGTNYIITGASTISRTWSANTFGGDGTYTNYTWEISLNGGSYSLVSTAPTYTRSFPPYAKYVMTLRLTAWSYGAPFANELRVDVVPERESCAPGQIC